MIKRLKSILKHDNLEYEFLSPALEIEETPPSPLKRMLVWLIFGITVSAFLWSYFGRVDEVAVARGKVIPDGRVKVIQPLESGVIRAIHVEDGQKVKKEQVLIELDPTLKQADMESTEKSLLIHSSDKERLMAELNKKESSQQSAISGQEKEKGQKTNNAGNGKVSKEIQEYQKKLKSARESEYRAREDALKLVIDQKESAFQAAGAILVKLEKTLPLVKEQEAALKTLYNEGIIGKMDLLNKQKELYAIEQELEAQKKVVKQARDSLIEAKKNLHALMREREKSILSEIVEKEKAISTIEGEVTKAKKKYELEMLTSPVDGTVHGLASHTIGGVVTPAQPVVTIVPEGTPLIIEAMALNQDIGFIKVGQDTEIKLDTFPFQKYGTINGKVVFISPDAFEDEKLGPVYKVKVKPDKLSIMVDGKEVALSPGMALSVEVKTGKRRIIEFFLSPIIKYAKESLTIR